MRLQKGLSEQCEILLVRPQRRKLDADHPQTIKQISRNLPCGSQRQIPVGRANHSQVHRNRLRPAKPLDRPFSSTRSTLACVTDSYRNLIQKIVPPDANSNFPFFCCARR